MRSKGRLGKALLALLVSCLVLQWLLRGLISRYLPDGKLPAEEQDPMRILQHDWSGGSGDCRAAAEMFKATLPPDSQALSFHGGAHAWREGLPSLQSLAELPDFSGVMITSPNSSFSIFVNSTAYQRMEREAPEQLPNRLLRLPFADFMQHAQRRRPPLFYGGTEKHYFQGALPEQMAFSRLLATSPLGCLGGLGGGRPTFNVAMLRVSPAAGATHHMHYDTSHTALVVLAGLKRVTLVHASRLARLDTYPRGHLLFRRARLPADGGGGWQALPAPGRSLDMRPGDVLVFPARTSHQTVALEDWTASMSVRYSLEE